MLHFVNLLKKINIFLQTLKFLIEFASFICFLLLYDSYLNQIELIQSKQEEIHQEVLLICPCPQDCECGNKKSKLWCHSLCQTSTYMNDEADIYCEDYKKDPNKCSKYFIQHISFRCINQTQWYQYKSAGDLCMALAQGMKAVEFSMSDQNSMPFMLKVMQKIQQNWKN